MAENLTPKKYIDSNNMKQILAAIKDKTPVGDEYVTEEQLLAKDYATKTYVGEQVVNAEHLKREIVTVLPSNEEASDNVIYMLKVESATGNDKYQEYMKIDGTVQMVGDTSVDLTDYAKTSDIPTTLPANGGNADTVNNHTVKSDVPENAVFTDTIYDDTEVKGNIAELNSKLNNVFKRPTDSWWECDGDVNNILDTGIGLTTNTYANLPDDGWGTLLSFVFDVSHRIQIVHTWNYSKFYIRAYYGTNWSGWKELATMDKVK